MGAALTLSALMAAAEVKDSPLDRYQTIIERNPFGLRPPPAPVPVTNAPPAVPSNIKFAGVTVDKNSKLAWLVLTPPGKPSEHFSIEEGGQHADIKVVKIDEDGPIVNVLQGDTPIKLTFETHGLTASKGAVAPPQPAAPAVVGVRPAGVPGVAQATGPTIISRGGVVSTLPQGGVGGAAGAPAMPAVMLDQLQGGAGAGISPMPITASFDASGGSIRTFPSRSLRTGSDQTLPPAPVVNPDVQAILMQANTIEAERRGIPMPPLPPLPGEVPVPPGQVQPYPRP